MDAVFYIGIAQGLFSAFVLLSRNRNTLPDRIMAFWMISISFELFHMLNNLHRSSLYPITSNFSFISITFGPFLYLYVTKLISQEKVTSKKELLNFMPYLVLCAVHLIFFMNQPMDKPEPDLSNGFFVLSLTKVSVLLISTILFSFKVIQILIRHQKSIENSYSYATIKITLNWLTQITLIFILTYFVLILFFLTDLNNVILSSSHYIPAFGLTLISFSLSYYGISQPSIFVKTLPDAEQAKLQYSTPDQIKILSKKLDEFIKINKTYLNPELTIQELAEQSKIPRHIITEIIKTEKGKNFFTYINEYRVEEAKLLLANSSLQSTSILAIGFESGFNSKSTFNALFKQFTGMTPSQYRENKG